jgi:effector-binding domain-containing protein
MIETPQVTESQAQRTAVIRLTVPRTEIQRVMGPAIQEVVETAAAQGVGPAGPVYAHHFRMSPETFDFEVSVPVAAPVTPAGRVTASELPAVRVLRTVYVGPYEGLGSAWGEFDAWIREHGPATAGSLWERYLDGPHDTPDPAAYRTELNRPLAE